MVGDAMRTTVTLAPDVAAAVESRRRERGVGVSEAINDLVRAGLIAPKPPRKPFVQKTYDAGIRVNVDNVAEVLDMLDDDDTDRHRC